MVHRRLRLLAAAGSLAAALAGVSPTFAQDAAWPDWVWQDGMGVSVNVPSIDDSWHAGDGSHDMHDDDGSHSHSHSGGWDDDGHHSGGWDDGHHDDGWDDDGHDDGWDD